MSFSLNANERVKMLRINVEPVSPMKSLECPHAEGYSYLDSSSSPRQLATGTVTPVETPRNGSNESKIGQNEKFNSPNTGFFLNTPEQLQQSPLRMVGRMSPCSVRLSSSSRLEGDRNLGTIIYERTYSSVHPGPMDVECGVQHILDNDMDDRCEQQYSFKTACPRELSFGNLLERDDIRINEINPRPIGFMMPSPVRQTVKKSPGNLPPLHSPRKRLRKSLSPIRSGDCI